MTHHTSRGALPSALPYGMTLAAGLTALILLMQHSYSRVFEGGLVVLPASFVTGLVLGLGFAASLGPQILYLIRTGLVRRHVGIVIVAGIGSELVLMSLSAVGAGMVAGLFAPARPYIIAVGALFLLWCGVRLLTQHNEHGIDHLSLRIEDRIHAIGHMLFVTWCNPLGYLKWAILAGVLVALPNTEAKLWCVLGMGVSSLLKFVLWPVAGQVLGHVLRHKETVVWFNRVSGLALMGSGVWTYTQF